MSQIEYCCKITDAALNICQHNIKVDGEKYHVKDENCTLTKSDIKDSIDVLLLDNGWIYDCPDGTICESL